ncbi:class I SAM-dependent methyltransferase [Actinoallomurus sp. NPDC052308]|uniref:class I SAM-dependent methyltransferase n=1 Tax=Actinoallomurus sp. NPDC052308 TaxID=3155530 RepID=UPI00341E59A8
MRHTLSPWQAHARQRIAVGLPGPVPAPDTMRWTQRPGSGPGAEILGDVRDKDVLELGCGAGHNLAHLAAHRCAFAIGVDQAGLQIRRARTYYGHIANMAFIAQDALAYLRTCPATFDVVYSVFGAIGLAPPTPLLRETTAVLKGGGLVAFSVPHPRRHGRRPANRAVLQHITLPDGLRASVLRWELTVERWLRSLNAAGLVPTGVREIFPPGGGPWPTTLLITAQALTGDAREPTPPATGHRRRPDTVPRR